MHYHSRLRSKTNSIWDPGWRNLCYFLVTAFLFLGGCATRTPFVSSVPHAAPSESIWQTFRQTQSSLPAQESLLCKATLTVISHDQHNRLRLSLWGNTPAPLRATLSSGLGLSLAEWREENEKWTFFFPQENKAYLHKNGFQGLAALGIDLPLSLKDLAQIIFLSLDTMIPEEFISSRSIPEGNREFSLAESTSPIRSVTLDSRALPVSFAGVQPRPWKLEIDELLFLDIGRPAIKIMSLQFADGKMIIMAIKEAVIKNEPWSEQSTALPLPADTVIVPLDQF